MVEDDKKGEKIVLLVKLVLSLEEINAWIKLFNVLLIMLLSWVLLVDEILLLGVGKVDFKGVKVLVVMFIRWLIYEKSGINFVNFCKKCIVCEVFIVFGIRLEC